MVYPADWENVTCHDWQEEERKIWLCLENKNAICEIAKNNNSVTVLGSFPHNGLADRDLSLAVGKLEKHNYMWDGIEKFYRMFLYNNCAYFFGIRYPAILELNLATNELTLFDEWLEKLEKHKCKEAVFFTDGYARKEDIIFLPIGRCNGVLKVNLTTFSGIRTAAVWFRLICRGRIAFTHRFTVIAHFYLLRILEERLICTNWSREIGWMSRIICLI